MTLSLSCCSLTNFLNRPSMSVFPPKICLHPYWHGHCPQPCLKPSHLTIMNVVGFTTYCGSLSLVYPVLGGVAFNCSPLLIQVSDLVLIPEYSFPFSILPPSGSLANDPSAFALGYYPPPPPNFSIPDYQPEKLARSRCYSLLHTNGIIV